MIAVTREREVLWFDVESKYDTTDPAKPGTARGLWFDVESKYDTTRFQI